MDKIDSKDAELSKKMHKLSNRCRTEQIDSEIERIDAQVNQKMQILSKISDQLDAELIQKLSNKRKIHKLHNLNVLKTITQ